MPLPYPFADLFNTKFPTQRQYKVFILSPPSPPQFHEKRYQSGERVTAPAAPNIALIVFCRWLRPVHRQLGEGNEEFALRVQQVVAYRSRLEVGSLLRQRGKKA